MKNWQTSDRVIPRHAARIANRRAGALAAAILGVCLGAAQATPYYWDANGTTAGAGSTPTGTWGTDSFWNTDSAGGSGTFVSSLTSSDDAYFSAGPSATSGNSAYTVTVSGTQSANGLVFQSSANAAAPNAATIITGGTINLGARGITASQYAYGTTSRGSVSVDSAIVLQASSTFTNNNSTNALWVKGAISDGASSFGIIKSGAGQLNLSGNNSFDGGVTLNAGTLSIRHANALGTGTLTINGGTLTIADTVTVNNNAQIWAGDFTVGTSNGVQRIGAGTVTLGGNRTVTVNSFQNLVVGGAISDGGSVYGLTKSGAGTITLSGASTYTGNTIVNAGTMVLSDNARLTFKIGANGESNQISGVGTLTLNGDFVFDLSGVAVALGNAWNIVNVGTLAETFGSTFSVVDFFDAGGDLWEKTTGGVTYQFSEATGNLVITAVPEPSAWALAGLGLILVTVFRRGRSRSV